MNYLICFTEEELGVVARALMEMPYKTVANLFSNLNQQISDQQQLAQASTEASAEQQKIPQKETAPVESE